MCMIMAFNGVIYMMRETGRLLLGIQARARFAAYSVFGRKTDCAAEFIKKSGQLYSQKPRRRARNDRLRRQTYIFGGGRRNCCNRAIGDRSAHSGRQKYRRKCHPRRAKIESCEETYRDLDTETDITDRHMNYIIPVRAGKIIYSLEVRIWNDGFGFRLLFGEETGLLISDELTRFNVPGDTVCRYQTDLKKMQGKTLTKKTSALPSGEKFLLHDRIRVPRKDIYTMITESDIENYPGMALRSLGAGKLRSSSGIRTNSS